MSVTELKRVRSTQAQTRSKEEFSFTRKKSARISTNLCARDIASVTRFLSIITRTRITPRKFTINSIGQKVYNEAEEQIIILCNGREDFYPSIP